MSNPPIYIVSGGTGASGKQLAQTALAQFPETNVEVIVINPIRSVEQLDDVVAQATETGGTIIHTLVDAELRGYLVDQARANSVSAIDPMGPLLTHLARKLQQQPLGQPGLFRKLREDYFKRVAAIEFAVDHDDGQRVRDLELAEIVLVGVSRVGKTPLSMYLATQGWKAANVPLVKGVSPPAELFEIDNRRVVGLTIEPGQLIGHRRARQQRLGTTASTAYTSPEAIFDEVEFARDVFRQGQFVTIDVTDRPIEETAEEVINRVIQRLLR
jgi:[pyruvate, water dikinase]-phosphate phosphotransferase / [pyruvate, water dikinase] kinase